MDAPKGVYWLDSFPHLTLVAISPEEQIGRLLISGATFLSMVNVTKRGIDTASQTLLPTLSGYSPSIFWPPSPSVVSLYRRGDQKRDFIRDI